MASNWACGDEFQSVHAAQDVDDRLGVVVEQDEISTVKVKGTVGRQRTKSLIHNLRTG